MDYLPLPEGKTHWIKVPYYVQDKYFYEDYGQGFDEYPKRRNWSSEDVWDEWAKKLEKFGDIEEKPSETSEVADSEKVLTNSDVEEFFQTWLFFGLIIEVFRLSNVEVTTQDFLSSSSMEDKYGKRSHIITAQRLPSLVTKWRENSQRSPNETIFEAAVDLCDKVGRIVDYYCVDGRTQRSPQQYGHVRWPVRDEITTSILAAASTIRKAAHQIYARRDEISRWPITNSETLRLRIQRKWCPSDAAMIMEDFDVDGHYYVAAAESHSLEYLDKHIRCTEDACNAKVEDGTYVTQHVDGCAVDDYQAEVPFEGYAGPGYAENPTTSVEAVRNIMLLKHFPFVMWKPDRGGLAVAGYAKNDYLGSGAFRTPPYVAISHVWADGMGNPFHNSLPACQLDRIQKMVDDLCDNHLTNKTFQQRPGFWMDTLCCLVGKDMKDFRDQSIAEMRNIYSEAVAVLVIDPWLTAIPSTAPMTQICYRIYTSGWSRRLWTHQEGYLGREVFYQFQDKPLSLSTINAKAIDFQRLSAAEGFPTTFAYEAQRKTGTYYDLVKPVINGIRDRQLPVDARATLYKTLIQSLGYRSTSKIDDEILCVASVIGLDVGPFFEVHAKTAAVRAEKRMVKFLGEISGFRQGIIFNTYRRLKTPGYRWAPASMLGHRFSGMGDFENSEMTKITDYSDFALQEKHIEFQSIGLSVNVTRFATKGLIWNPGLKYMTLWIAGKPVDLPAFGLPVDYPGYIIKFTRPKHNLTVDMAERRFGIQIPTTIGAALLKAPSLPKTPSFGRNNSKILPRGGLSLYGSKDPPPENKSSFGLATPKLSKLGIGKQKPEPIQPESEPEATETVFKREERVGTDQYVVYVPENDVVWEFDKPYALVLQRSLESKPKEFKAMIGHCSAGPGSKTWVESLCSSDVRVVDQNDSRKVTAGIDFVDVSDVKSSWVVT